jgi:O-acetylserine/cysteine efflux transporter
MTRRHVALAVAVAVVWGLNFVVIDEGLKVFPPLLFVALRFVIVLFPAIFIVGRPRVPARYVIGVGAFSGALQFALLFISLSIGMPPGLASLVVQLQVVFTIAIAAVFLGERPHRRQLAGALVALGGVAVIAATRTGVVVPLGALALCIAGSASWGIGNVITRIARPSDAAAFLVWTSLVPPVPLLLLSLLTEGPARIGLAFRSLTVSAVLALVYVAVLSTGFAYGSWAFLLRRYPASSVSPFSLIVPVVGLAAAAVFVHETPSIAEVVGAAVVILGLTMVTRSVRRVEIAPEAHSSGAPGADITAPGPAPPQPQPADRRS